MLLTLAPPIEEKFRVRTPHAPPGYTRFPVNKLTSNINGYAGPDPHPRHREKMSTPHRGLPLPGPMTLSGDPRASQNLPPPQPVQYAPLPSQSSHPSQDDRSREDYYYAFKSEEEKRKQMEETTKQEDLKLEQRRVEYDMLRHAIEAGVPPPLLPFIFAAIGGGMGSAGASEMVSQYLQRLPPSQQPLQTSVPHSEPGLRRETRTIGGPQSFPPSQVHPSISGQQPPPHAANAAYPSPAYASPANRGLMQDPNGFAMQGQKPSAISSLPRLTTNEAQIMNPPTAPSFLSTSQERASPSPSIYFHHWQPPSSTQGSAPGSKDTAKTSPNQVSQPSSTELHNDSPRKRKATGPHQPAPVPSTAPGGRGTSPAFSERSTISASQRSGHVRQTSDQQRRAYDPVGRSNRRISRRNSSQDERLSRRGSPSRMMSQEMTQSHRSEMTKTEANS